jgi:hypothetical protein
MDSQNELQNLLSAHHEWLLIDASGRSFALQRAEIEITGERGKTLLGFLDDQGFQTWRVAGFRSKGVEILVNLTRNFEKEHAKIRLVPRTPAKDLSASVELARLAKAEKIAGLIKTQFPRIKLVRIGLNKENGRLAQIAFEDFSKKQTAVISDVSAGLSPEILLAAAIVRLVKLGNRKKNPVETLWILAEKTAASRLRKLHALLGASWKTRILIKEISRQDAQTLGEENIKDLPALEISSLWRGKAREIKAAADFQSSAAAREIIEFAPREIDAVFSKNGETLRFHGLPFARVRRVSDKERVWFGIEKTRQLLSDNNFGEFTELLESLQEIRRHDSANKRHALYSSAPEAWLEARLRRNIKLLDANLVLSPVYHQFRAGRERVDLLALRADGRLVIIELKTAPDRAMAFQAADYWRKIEFLRRRGVLDKARLFGDLEIAEKPAICYLVAPTLAFHREFDFLAGAISSEIGLHRFNLAENWRDKLKVLERKSVAGN